MVRISVMVAVIALGVPSALSAPVGSGESNGPHVPADPQLPNAPPPQLDGSLADPPPRRSGLPPPRSGRFSHLVNPADLASRINPNLLASMGLPALTGDHFKDVHTISAYTKRKRTNGDGHGVGDDATTPPELDPKAASGRSVGDVHGGGRR